MLSDTMPTEARMLIARSFSPAQDVAKRCMHRFSEAEIPLNNLRLAQQLYLLAGQDAEASAIVLRRLSMTTTADSAQRVAVLDSVIREYLYAPPPRFDSLLPFMDEITRLRDFSTLRGVIEFSNRYFNMLSQAESYDRQDIVQQYGKRFLSIMGARIDSSSPEEANRIRRMISGINSMAFRAEFMDSLRISTAAYTRAQQQKMIAFTPNGSTGYRIFSESRSPIITGDFVFPVSAQNDHFPRLGTVTLIVLLSGDQRNGGAAILGINSKIRRLKKQFPKLDIVLVAATEGALVPSPPPSPEKEAAVFQDMLLRYAKLPATLIVSKRPFARMPDPDRRVIGEPTELEIQTGLSLSVFGNAILVDKNGFTVKGMNLLVARDDDLSEIVQAVMEQ